MVTAMVTVLIQGLSRSTAAALVLLGDAFGGIVVSDRFPAFNHPIQQRQLCWAHLKRDLTAIAERPGASGEFGAELLELQQQLVRLEQLVRLNAQQVGVPPAAIERLLPPAAPEP